MQISQIFFQALYLFGSIGPFPTFVEIYLTVVNTGGDGGGPLDRLGAGNLGDVVGILGLLGGQGLGGEGPGNKHGKVLIRIKVNFEILCQIAYIALDTLE